MSKEVFYPDSNYFALEAQLDKVVGEKVNLQTQLADAEEREKMLNDLLWSGGVVYEDELPEMTDDEFDKLYHFGKVNGVRVYPKIAIEIICGQLAKER